MAGAPAPPSRVRARPLTRRRLTDLAAAAILSCLAFVGLFPYLYEVGACAWGVQFHPEFDAEIMRAYAAEEKRASDVNIVDTPFGGRILKRFASLTKGQSEVIDGR